MARPRIYLTDEERLAARKASHKKSRAKTKTLKLDADVVASIHWLVDEFENVHGYRPTLSDTIRSMIRIAMQKGA